EYAFARAHRLSDVALINHSGQVVRAGIDTFHAAVAAANWEADITRQIVTDLPGKDSWPITGASFVLVETSPERSPATLAVLQFYDWALHQEQSTARLLNYLPVPESVVSRLPELWSTLQDTNGKPIWPGQ